jgi:hypothetical protein
MFPPMCLPAAEEKDEMGLVLNSSELDVVEGEQKYKVEFKTVEFIVTAKDFLRSHLYNPMEKFMHSDSFNAPVKYDVDFKLAQVFSEIKSSLINA